MNTRPLLASLAMAFSVTAAHAADSLTVQLDWLPGGDKAFVYAGVQQGFFKAEGLDVKIVPGRGSSDAVTKIASGAADVGFGGISALMMAAAESSLKMHLCLLSVFRRLPAPALKPTTAEW